MTWVTAAARRPQQKGAGGAGGGAASRRASSRRRVGGSHPGPAGHCHASMQPSVAVCFNLSEKLNICMFIWNYLTS